MKLKDVLNGIDTEFIKGKTDIEISELRYDSREVEENNLFIAVSGFEADGHDYIENAVENGAAAVVIENEIENYRPDITYIRVGKSRRVMAELANNFFGHPLRYIDLIGITGTNGKTTTAYLIYKILKKSGIKTALFGTIKNIIGDKELDSKRTTPESVDLYRYFRRMVEEDVSYAVMEVSSHALDLYRVYGMEFTLAVFTNLTSEHLDYHKDLTSYRQVKSKLFSQLNHNGFAVVNIDDSSSSLMLKKSSGENYTYSLNNFQASLFVKEYNLDQAGIKYNTSGLFEENYKLKLGGIFNIYNSLAAVLSTYLLGIKKGAISDALLEVEGVPGRFELINCGQDYQVIVDYAHTSDGMKNVLEAAENIKKNRMIVLFGCGGDRDKGKRPAMAELAEKHADYVIVSNDNPRSEDPDEIFSDIKEGFSSDFNKYEIIADRREAIQKAVNKAEKDDIVLLLGRGHEKYQIIKDQKIELDDREVAKKAVKNRQV